MANEDLIARLKADQERSRQVVRGMLSGQALAEFDASMEHVDSGHSSLESVWHSISPAQRAVVQLLREGDRKLVRSRTSQHRYDAVGSPHAVRDAARAPSVNKLVRHDLLAFAGSPDDPEQIAVPTLRFRDLCAYLASRN